MRKIILFVLILISISSYSQKKYFVYLKDKTNTPFTINNPIDFLSQRSIDRRVKQNIPIKKRDLPVDPAYITSIKNTGATVWYSSRWFNAVLLETDTVTINTINNLSFVKSSEPLEKPSGNSVFDEELWMNKNTKPIPHNSKNTEVLNYGSSESQNSMIGADIMHTNGFIGEGIFVAVHDNGFMNVDQISYFDKLRNENRILGTYDFVNNNTDVYDSGSHGTMVLSTMAAYAEGEIIGTGYGASYYLFVTENGGGENIDEEVNWLIAAERSDSLGVDLINTSLGYTEFDNSTLDHTYSDMDGRTTIISKASEIAANVGMVIVTSAGNSGSSSWFYISAPADADSIIAVGAVDEFEGKASFSSFGPSADGRIKPDLAAMGVNSTVIDPTGSLLFANGTSFASPILCGMAAGFWGANPQLSAQEVIQLLKESANQYQSPDSLLGYGIPNFKIANELANGINFNDTQGGPIVFPNPVKKGEAIFLSIPVGDSILKVEIFNSLGQKMDEKIFVKHYTTMQFKSKTELVNGTYLIRVTTKKGILMEKITVQ